MTLRAGRGLTVVLLLLPGALGAVPGAPGHLALHVEVTQAGDVHASWAPLGAVPLAATSECYAMAPLEFTCQGADINVSDAPGTILHFTFAIDPEAASTSYIHISQVVNKTAVFAYNCRAPEVLWVTLLVLHDQDCTTFGKAQFGVTAHVRLDIPYLPQAGIVSLGGWDVTMGT